MASDTMELLGRSMNRLLRHVFCSRLAKSFPFPFSQKIVWIRLPGLSVTPPGSTLHRYRYAEIFPFLSYPANR